MSSVFGSVKFRLVPQDHLRDKRVHSIHNAVRQRTAESDRAESLHDEISRLAQERNQLKADGVIALSGCWIETGVVDGRQFRQAWWRSKQAMFPSKRVPGEWVKTCYIGEEREVEHKEAIAARERRNRLKWVDRRLSKLMEGV